MSRKKSERKKCDMPMNESNQFIGENTKLLRTIGSVEGVGLHKLIIRGIDVTIGVCNNDKECTYHDARCLSCPYYSPLL